MKQQQQLETGSSIYERVRRLHLYIHLKLCSAQRPPMQEQQQQQQQRLLMLLLFLLLLLLLERDAAGARVVL